MPEWHLKIVSTSRRFDWCIKSRVLFPRPSHGLLKVIDSHFEQHKTPIISKTAGRAMSKRHLIVIATSRRILITWLALLANRGTMRKLPTHMATLIKEVTCNFANSLIKILLTQKASFRNNGWSNNVQILSQNCQRIKASRLMYIKLGSGLRLWKLTSKHDERETQPKSLNYLINTKSRLSRERLEQRRSSDVSK